VDEGAKWNIFNNIGSLEQGPIHAVYTEVKKDQKTIGLSIIAIARPDRFKEMG